MDFVFLLIHSPLVSALTWEPTAEHLDALGCKVCVPSISNPIATDTSYFEIHRQQVLEQVSGNPREPYLVVGHSGAGALLPLLLQSLGDKARIVFVDADLPLKGRSRFDLFRDGLADNWRGQAEEGNLPVLWAEEELTALITDENLRRRFAGELRPTPIRVYEESIPLNRPDYGTQTGYVLLSNSYSEAYSEAERLGWVLAKRDSTHFHMLNEPQDMAEILCEITEHLT